MGCTQSIICTAWYALKFFSFANPSDALRHTDPFRSLAAIKGRTSIELLKKDTSSLGLTISGGIDKDGKPRVAQLKPGSVAQKADVLEIGDILLGVNGIKTAGLKHEQVIDIIKQVGDQLTLDIEYDLPKWRMWNKFFLVFSLMSSSSFAYNYA